MSAAIDILYSNEARSIRPQFHVEKLLGQGTFGKVYLVRDTSTGKLKALKRTQKWKRTASREVLCMEESRGSASLVAADSIFYSTTPGGFTVQNVLMEYMGCSLQSFLSKIRKERRADNSAGNTFPWIRHMASQIVHGVYELHSRGILHRDLKPENVLIDDKPNGSMTVRICDMGSSKRLTYKDEHSMPYICSRWYRAPELLLGATQYSMAVDLWSLGCLLAELICLRPLLECEVPFCTQAKPAEHTRESGFASEVFQLMALVELLGSPNECEKRGNTTMG
ncbi:cyclin-dependent kinase B2-1-like [Cyclospora cayetanensis]|uniref:Cyclin-dependent kinase B2-1-like n=1 Tax=Cyclospora cayetanensis TaxID=88456 RepID=A0A6P6RWQ2_9EIME|nr:cyclin-dependent kinase B2-1-like [Cyclospora cayetanensis]